MSAQQQQQQQQQQPPEKALKHKRRFCRTPGCTRIVKSQGLCQRHGAKPRSCKVDGCTKQAQGNFDGMCKAHFKAHKRIHTPLPPKPTPAESSLPPPPPSGASVYDHVLPSSIAWQGDPAMMPLILHLKAGFDGSKAPAWHRNEERRARGLREIHNPAVQLEGWERELVWMEILLLTGNPHSSFRHLARSWGRDKGFHTVLAQYICERHGDVERKKRGNNPHHKIPANVISANVWDDACYGGAAINEELALDLFNFEPGDREHSFETAKSTGSTTTFVAQAYKNEDEQDDDYEACESSSGGSSGTSRCGDEQNANDYESNSNLETLPEEIPVVDNMETHVKEDE